jgi:hypothetical protein
MKQPLAGVFGYLVNDFTNKAQRYLNNRLLLISSHKLRFQRNNEDL